MVLTFTACNDDIDNDNNNSNSTSSATDFDSDTVNTDSIVGDWKGAAYIYRCDTIEVNGNYYGPNNANDHARIFRVGVEFTFNEDNTYKKTVNTKDFVNMEIEAKRDACECFLQDFDEYILKQGYSSVDEWKEALTAEYANLISADVYEYKDGKISSSGMTSYWDGKYLIIEDYDAMFVLERV